MSRDKTQGNNGNRSRPLPWFRMYSEAIDDEKLRLLAFEDRWHFVALLCCKSKGLIDEPETELKRRKIALKMGLAYLELDEVARRLSEVGLIDRKTLQPLAWDERQYQSDNSTERVRAYRERVKRQRNVSVTAQDTDTDTEKGTCSRRVSSRVVATSSVGGGQPGSEEDCPW